MSANGQSGIVMFAPQNAMSGETGFTAPATTAYWKHRAANVDLGVIDDVRVGPPEVGGRPLPTLPYKGGVAVGGGADMNFRLENSLGFLLYGMLGDVDTDPAIVEESVLARTKILGTTQTISTGFVAIPSAPKKIAVRIHKADGAYVPTALTITVSATATPAVAEVFNFITGPGAGQHTFGVDTNPGSGVCLEQIVSSAAFGDVVSVVVAATPAIPDNTVYVSIGYEDATAKSHVFGISAADPNLVKWMSFRKVIPANPSVAGAVAYGETYQDCKIVSMMLGLPNDGLIGGRVDVLGRTYTGLSDPLADGGADWDDDSHAFEDYQSVPISTVIGGHIKVPYFSDTAMPVVGARVSWANQPLDLRQERIYGSPYLEDITITGRQLSFDITVKYTNADLYRAVLNGSVSGNTWSSTPFTSRLDIMSKAPGLIPNSNVPYSLRVQAQKVLLAMNGPITLGAGRAVTMRFTGTALDVGGTYASYTLTNGAASYAWPA